jgi:hypothetical protein
MISLSPPFINDAVELPPDVIGVALWLVPYDDGALFLVVLLAESLSRHGWLVAGNEAALGQIRDDVNLRLPVIHPVEHRVLFATREAVYDGLIALAA